MMIRGINPLLTRNTECLSKIVCPAGEYALLWQFYAVFEGVLLLREACYG
jgi:hypothetical protein